MTWAGSGKKKRWGWGQRSFYIPQQRKLRCLLSLHLIHYSATVVGKYCCVAVSVSSLSLSLQDAAPLNFPLNMDRLASEAEDETDSVFVGEESDVSSRPSSRASSTGRLSPALESTSEDMENVAWEDLPLEKIYELFASLRGVQRAFGALKSRLGADGLEGMALFHFSLEVH